MYYSWFNISSTLNNNKFYYTWYNAAGLVSVNGNPYFTITVPDGLYEIVQLNNLLQFNMINNSTYLIDTATGQNVYYAEFLVNPTRYAVQINTFSFPTSLPTGYALPSNWATYVGSFSAQTFNPSITLPYAINNILPKYEQKEYFDVYRIWIGFKPFSRTRFISKAINLIIKQGGKKSLVLSLGLQTYQLCYIKF
jgi:hypothetical protein